MEATREVWRPIPGAEGRYDVSDQGRVRSWLPSSHAAELPHLLSQARLRGNYLGVSLSIDGLVRSRSVHQLVLEAFLGPRPKGLEVRHLDGNRQNNRVSNLVYGTGSENTFDAVEHGTHPQASKTHCPAGHDYAEHGRQNAQGHRACRICRAEQQAAYRARNLEEVRRRDREGRRA